MEWMKSLLGGKVKYLLMMIMLLAFGVGILLGTWMESGLVCHLFGLLAIFCGIGLCGRK